MNQYVNIGSVSIYNEDGSGGYDYSFILKPGDYISEDATIALRDNMGFGASMDFQDDRVIVGCPNEEPFNASGDIVWENKDIGAVYIFNSDTGDLIQKIVPDNTPGEWTVGNQTGKVRRQHRFGFSVAAGDDFIVIGAPGYQDNISNTTYEYSGRAYVYKWNGSQYNLAYTIAPNSRITNNRFGDTVLVDGNAIVITNSPKAGTANSGNTRYIELTSTRTGSVNDVLIKNTHASWQYSITADQGRIAIGNHASNQVSIYVIIDGISRLDQTVTEDKLKSFEFGYDLKFDEDKLLIGCPNGYYKLGVVLRMGKVSGTYTLV